MIATPTRYGIDSVELGTDGALLIIDGWAIDSLASDVAGGVAVILDGTPHPAHYGMERGDVARTLENQKLVFSGFRCPISAKDIAPGKHSLVLKIQSRDRKAVFEMSEQIAIHKKQEDCCEAGQPPTAAVTKSNVPAGVARQEDR